MHLLLWKIKAKRTSCSLAENFSRKQLREHCLLLEQELYPLCHSLLLRKRQKNLKLIVIGDVQIVVLVVVDVLALMDVMVLVQEVVMEVVRVLAVAVVLIVVPVLAEVLVAEVVVVVVLTHQEDIINLCL